MSDSNVKKSGLENYLNPINVWALSFGCAVGWGAFVMPGTTFLPSAGPLGTFLGILIGAFIMLIIGINYHYLMNKFPDAGGTLSYTVETFGYDHGFLSSWFLMLVYIAIIWANASAMGLISKNLFGSTFQFGFHYVVLGYDVYMGEVLLSIGVIIICVFACIYGRNFSANIQVLFAFLLLVGIIIVAIFAHRSGGSGITEVYPHFAENGKIPIRQIIKIVALSPWAFVGFESVSNSVEGFKFSVNKTIWIFVAALFASALSYILLVETAVSIIPEEFESWSKYILVLSEQEGLKGLPTFYAASRALGNRGITILGIAAFSGIMTGLIGNTIAASRLMYSMAGKGMLPKWFGELNKEKIPQNAIVFLMIISLFIPFLGRTAIGWIVDVNTVGATIAYAYTSVAAFVNARKDGNKLVIFTSVIGIVSSLLFFFYFMAWSAEAMSTESYLILAGWSILGFVYFRFVFERDKEHHFGKSTIVWITVLFLIFFTSLMWVKKSTDDMTHTVVGNISKYYEAQNKDLSPEDIRQTKAYINSQLLSVDRAVTRNSIIQMMLIIASLGIMISIYSIMQKREKEAEYETIKAHERSRAKTVFLSNMSHDIRTPMNAIIGYINIAEREAKSEEELREYLSKIKGSSQHLLALINDVLEMSRIESGKLELELVPVNLKKTISEVYTLFETQMSEKKIDFVVDVSEISDYGVYCDRNRLNRVLLNLVSNAYKFTPENGKISVIARQLECSTENTGRYEIRVKDSGIGMSKEFAEKVFEAFEREKTSTVSGIQGTGLGMSITKNIIDLMGGTIDVKTVQGKGTEFIIIVEFSFVSEEDRQLFDEEERETNQDKNNVDLSTKKVLLVEDMPVNRQIAIMQLKSLGLTIDTADNGQVAVDMLKEKEPGYYDAVLMDIQMPVLDGYEATKVIRDLGREDLKNIPIIAMTANAFSEDVKKALDSGMNAHVAKPIDMVVLENVLRNALC
ncbi:MAG: amino acid permease [Butyrivibrio sp.]|nr:amino acid permease [Butyrivibrio sp.]